MLLQYLTSFLRKYRLRPGINGNRSNCRVIKAIDNNMELGNKSPHFTWNSCPQPRIQPRSSLLYGDGTWPQPPCQVWPCRPWWTWPEIIKFAWEYALVHYSKSPCLKNTRKFLSKIFFLSKLPFFQRLKKLQKIREKKTFLIFCEKKVIILLGTDKTYSNKSKLDQNQWILRHFRPKNGHISKLGMFYGKSKKSDW